GGGDPSLRFGGGGRHRERQRREEAVKDPCRPHQSRISWGPRSVNHPDASPGQWRTRAFASKLPVMAITPSASYSFTVRLEIKNKPGMLGRVTSVIGKVGGDIGAVDLAEMTTDRVLRDITVKTRDSAHAQRIVERLRRIPEVR